MQDLLPHGTVVVANTAEGTYAGYWSVDCPTLTLSETENGGLKRKVIRAVAQKVGWLPTEASGMVKQFLQEHHVEVVMGEYLDFSLAWLGVARKLGLRFFAHAHGYDVSRQLRNPHWRAEYLQYNQASGVITMSQTNRKRLIELGLEPTKVHVVPYGVDVPQGPWTREEQETIRCVAVGRMVAKKAPILTLDAFRRAVKECPKLRLDYVGTGELLPAAQQFVRAFNLGDRVTLHRGQPSEVVQRLMREGSMFLQHSMTDPETGDEEGLPVAILEAMANSLPVVSTRHAGIPEAVQDESTGYLVDEGDSVAMAERLLILANDADLRRSMGEAGWHRAKEHFSWEKERVELLRILGLPQRPA